MPNAPDVRVRLSAEGMAEVMAAFKRIQSEADKTRKAGGTGAAGVDKLTGALGGLKGMLATLGAGAALAGIVALTKQSLDLADSFSKLNLKTGISVETISTLSFGARTAAVSQEGLQKGLIKFTKSMDDYDQGLRSAKDAVAQLFGSEKALQGLNQDQRLKKIVDQLAQLEPGAKRTGAAMAIFGKSGAELLPLMDDLGNGGFDELRKKAEKLGLVINDDLAQKAVQANDAMEDLKSAVQGIATRFTAGLAPALADVADALVGGIVGDGVDGFQVLGEWAGNVLKGIVIMVSLVVGGIAKIGQRVTTLVTSTYGLVTDVLRGRFTGAWERFKTKMVEEADAFDTKLQARYTKILTALSGNTERKKPKARREVDTSISEDLATADREKKAALALAEAQADAEARLAQAKFKEQEAAEKDRYEKGLESLAEYYAARIALAKQAADAEEKALYKKIEELQTRELGRDELPAERQAAIVKATSDYQAKVMENAAALNNLQAEQTSAMDALQQKILDAEKKIQKVQGDRFSAARADIDAQANALDDLLKKQGVAPGEKSQRVEAFRAAGYQQIDFEQLQDSATKTMAAQAAARAAINRQAAQGQIDELTRQRQTLELDNQRLPVLREIAKAMATTAITDEQMQAARDFQTEIENLAFEMQRDRGTRALQDLDRAQQDINRRVQEGQLYAFQGEEQIRQLEMQRLPLLQQIAAAMKAAAITDDQRQAAADFQAQIDQLATSTNKAALEMGAFKQSVQDAATSDLANFFTSGIDGAESLGDAFRGLASSVVNSLRQIAAQMLANLLIQKMLGAIAGGAGGAPMATGGLVRGPGTGTSDSIPARLSNYEYVVRSAVVKRPGMLEFLNTLNYGSARLRPRGGHRFSDGGLVTAAAGGRGGQAGLTAVLGLDEGLLLKRLEASPEFSRVFVRTAQSNQKAMKSALGGG